MDSRHTLTPDELTRDEQYELGDILSDFDANPAYAESATLVLEYAGRILTLPRPLLSILHTMMGHLVAGRPTGIVSTKRELDLAQAADILGISPEHVGVLLGQGLIRHNGTGHDRTVLLIDLLAYQANAQSRCLSEEQGPGDA